MERDLVSLLDALIFAQRILEFTSGMDRVAFENDFKTQAAVLYQISVLGEAMRRISPEFRESRNSLCADYRNA